MELFHIEMRRLCKDIVATIQYLKGPHKRDGRRLFTKTFSGSRRSDGFKLKEGKFRLDVRKKFFTMYVG